MATKPHTITGGCHCGAIRYALASPPQASMICHCRTCRAVSGAPVLAWISTSVDNVIITQGEPARYASSSDVQRQFCATCGTQLTYIGPGYENAIDITTASLDDANAFPPTHHSWLSHDLTWLKFGDGLPTFPQSRDD
jgi:hypothetical protein